MAWTAATAQATVEACRQAAIKFELAIEAYIQVNNPGLLADAQAKLDALQAAMTTLEA